MGRCKCTHSRLPILAVGLVDDHWHLGFEKPTKWLGIHTTTRSAIRRLRLIRLVPRWFEAVRKGRLLSSDECRVGNMCVWLPGAFAGLFITFVSKVQPVDAVSFSQAFLGRLPVGSS